MQRFPAFHQTHIVTARAGENCGQGSGLFRQKSPLEIQNLLGKPLVGAFQRGAIVYNSTTLDGCGVFLAHSTHGQRGTFD